MTGVLHDPRSRARLAAWLSQALGEQVRITAAARPGSGGGWSNETVMLTTSSAAVPRIVLRIEPDGPAMFRDYDLSREYRVLTALSGAGGPPVPEPIALDASGAVLGRPAFAMRHVDGLIPSDDRPGYAEAGWLHVATPAEQRRFHTGLIDALAALHAVDWRRLQLERLGEGLGTCLAETTHWLRELYLWGSDGAPQPLIMSGLSALAAVRSPASPPCLLWGDARPANVVARQFAPVALLDWELAHLGAPEMDVAWLIEMHRMRTIGVRAASLQGFLDEAGVVVRYQHSSGRRLAGIAVYRLFAVVKMAALMERYLRVAIARGALPSGHRLLGDNVALRRLADLLAA
jgi:aminoglycoside phosphotransferase (APT) family kinase protein